MATVKMYTSAYCPYCSRAKALLEKRGVTDLEEVFVDGQPELRAHMRQLTGRTSVPQIFIGQTHVGGCDDLHALDSQGGLMPLLQA
ncbi:glutaredoxin 3 [Hydrogenophaga taeniospiralis CCUG 15921]|uniref:Glutaredoxin n=1 Tax=Hydrogenophaga taeniospiralis CCUG 15921 TaxID=1281780 RepID=A0A9X4S8A1_9BURK|nr:glutaredoxin 3 [Hydrogenophaga taeniospiralis]MDG5976172.1 glutaredoxin 3 [Hydrogenophaga taeniospiralis CCUG 15921]